MEFVDLNAAKEFSPQHHIHKSLTATPRSDISIACWEPGQASPIHRHPGADEIYHVVEGRGLTRMVLYRVQAGADRHPESLDAWPSR